MEEIMNNNQISNPKKEVPKGIKLNDKDYISKLLSCLKEMEKNYVVAMTEASNENLFNKYKNVFNDIVNLQREVYEIMFRNGWYQLEKVENNKINSKLTMFSQELNDLIM